MSIQSIGSSSSGMLTNFAASPPAATSSSASPSVASAGPSTNSASPARQTPANMTAQAIQANAKAPNSKEIQDAVKDIQKAVQPFAQELQFSIDKDTGDTIVKVMDTATKKVVRQIPSVEILEIAKSIDKFRDKLQGILVEQKA